MSNKSMYVDIRDFVDGTFQPETPPDVLIITAPPITNGDSPFIEWWGDGYVNPQRPRPMQPNNGNGNTKAPPTTLDGRGVYEINEQGYVYDVSVNSNGNATEAKFKHEVKHAEKGLSESELEERVKISAEFSFREWYSKKYIGNKYSWIDNTKSLRDNIGKSKSERALISKDKGYYVRDTEFMLLNNGIKWGMSNQVERDITKFISDSLGKFDNKNNRLIERQEDFYVRGVKIADFTGIPSAAFDFAEFDMVNTLSAEPFISKQHDGKSLSDLADRGGTIEVNGRVALIKNKQENKTTAYVIQPDNTVIGRNIPIIKAKYSKKTTTFYYNLFGDKLSVGRVFTQNITDMGFIPIVRDTTLKSNQITIPSKIELSNKTDVVDIKLPYEYQINDAIVVFPDGSNMNPIYVYYGYPKSAYIDELKNSERKRQEEQHDQLKTGIKATLDFYKEVTEKLGVKAEKLAESLAASSKGKKIGNAEDALKAFEKYKSSLGEKYGVKDREAIAKALESRDTKLVADRLNKMSKVFFKAGKVIDYADLGNELVKAIKTDNWRPFFVKAETLIAGNTAGAATAFAFSIVLGGPVGIIGFALIMAVVGALVDEQLVEQINKTLGI